MRKDENMKRIRFSNKARKTLGGSSRGFTLIEVLIALALFTIIAFVFAGGLSTASRAVLTADVRTRAESLARTQMESVKNQGYQPASGTAWQALYDKVSIPGVTDGSGTYSICSCSRTGGVNCTGTDVIAVAWDSATNNATTSETGLQKVTLVIKHDGTEVTRLEGYKVDR
jgi:prepilin-type N-terminal cleavage/methylation domain-containing protein